MRKHRYTSEQIEFIRENAEGNLIEEIHRLFIKKFEVDVTFKSIKGIMYRHGIKNSMQGFATRFRNDHTPWNKGVKGLNTGGEKGWFQKGNVPPSTLDIGTERVESGFVFLKVAQPNKWQLKHHYLYERYKGVIPKNYKVIFADGNKRNFDLENLLLISPGEFFAATKRGLLFDTTEATKTGVLLAKYLIAVNQKEVK